MLTPEKLLEVIRIQTEVSRLGADLGGVMSLVAEEALGLIGADGAVIELAEGEDMVYRAAAGITQGSLGLRLQRTSSLSGLAVSTGETLSCDDTENDPRVNREACRKVGIRSMIVMPLRHNDATVGALKVVSARPGGFLGTEASVLQLLSGLVGAAMFYAAKYDTEVLFHKATHDAMTDLANRSLFMDRLRSVLARSTRDKRLSGVLVVDMDGLKQTNDSYGHRVGDAVIVEFSRRLRNVSRKSDTVARLGGDEFGLILTPIDSREGLSATTNRLHNELSAPFVFEGQPFYLRASVGGAIVPEDGEEAERIVEVADIRMYEVKRGSAPKHASAADAQARG
ncbi:sensor domain-containing diguanylate cyclase [Niveibacterium sp. SC-1]|uniref:sensor domain-containing diguanylate cyclase n=1 Tax=Niveibacterium sp. SC-1 TaxID=3135646 RepID=UPI00311F63B7